MKYLGMKSALAKLAGAVVLGVMLAPMAQAQVTVNVSPGMAPQMFASEPLAFTATVTGDPLNKGVTWSLGGTRGVLSLKTTTSVTYTAPSYLPSQQFATLTATSKADTSKVATVNITLNTAFTKAPVAGLTAMGDVSYGWKGGYPNNNLSEVNKHTGVYAGAVINVLWSQLEPTLGVFDFSAIEGTLSPITAVDYTGQGMAALVAYNSNETSHSLATAVGKIRIHVDGPPPSAGNYPGMPNFVLGYGGTAGGVTIGSNNQVGAYWAADTQSAFTALQAELAAYYDANPLLEEVTVETCASVGGEPYIEATDITSLTTLRGLTDTAYNDTNRKACFTAAASAYSAWTTTAIDSDYNQFLGTDGCTTAHPTSCVVKDPVFTTTTMAAFAAPSGVRNSRLLVANHDLPAAGYPITGGLATFYPEFNTLGSPVELQTTVGLNGVGACQALQLGVQYSMTEMEIHQTEDAPNGAQGSSATILDDAQLAALKGLLAARDHTSNCNLTSVMPAYIAGT